MKKPLKNTLKARNLVVYGAVPLALIGTAASCGQSESSTSENTPARAVLDSIDWFEAASAPRINPNNIQRLNNETAAIKEINIKDSTKDGPSVSSPEYINAAPWAQVICRSMTVRLRNSSEPGSKWGKNYIEFFAHFENGKYLSIQDVGLEPTGFPKLLTNILSEIINRVWKISNHADNDIFTPPSLVSELLRLTNSKDNSFNEFVKIMKIFKNYTNPSQETTDETKTAWYSWANLLHFVQIALDPTPEGRYPYEGLLAMLQPLGKVAVDAFNDSVAKPWKVEVVSEGEKKITTILGGYDGTKLNWSAPRKSSKK